MFAGNDTPATVAGFFPVALQRLTIAIPHVPTDSHIQAAFDVSNLAVRAFGLEPSRVDIVSIGTNVTPDDLERFVVIDPTAPTGISIDGRVARIGGDDSTITKTAKALGTDARPLMQTPQAIIDQATQTALPDRSRYSFADLDIPEMNLDGIGRVERTIALSQANVGGPAHSWKIRAIGAYEPQPESSKATFSVLTNGTR